MNPANVFILSTLMLIPQEEITPKVYELDEVVVTAKKIELSPNLIMEISSEDLEAKGARTVGEALHFIPSVYPRTGRKGENYIEIFGIMQREIVIMLDGHPVYSPYIGTADLDQIPLDNISKIEVALPPTSLFHGVNSLGGLVNIVTKKYAKSASFAARKGTSLNSVVNYGDKLGDFYYYFSGGLSNSDGYPLPDGSIRENSDYNKRRFTGKIGWEPNSKSELSVSVANYWSEKGIPPGSIRPVFWRFTDWKWWYTVLHGETEFFQRIKLSASGFYDTHKNTLISYDDSTYTAVEEISDYDNHTSGAYTTVTVKSGKLSTTTLGGSFKIDCVNIKTSKEPLRQHEGQTVSLSIQEKMLIPISKIHLEGELGYDGFTGGESRLHVVNYRAGVVYIISSGSTVFFSIGKKNRVPTLKELYCPSSGNPDLLPERSISYQFGIDLKEQIRLVLFRNNVFDLIDRETSHSNFENLNWACFQGFSISGSYKFFTVGYTFLDAYDEFYESLDNRAKNSVTLGFNYRLNSDFNMNLNGLWIDRRKDGDEFLEPYTIVNANVRQKIGKFVIIELFCSNITNEWYEDEKGYPLAGRTFGAKLSLVSPLTPPSS